MGFKLRPREYDVHFDNPALQGLQVKVIAPPFGVLLRVQQGNFEAEDFGVLATSIVSWNLLGDDDQEIPRTVDGFYSLPADFIRELIEAWMQALVSVPAPLEHGSNAGGPSLAESLPMEPLSPSQAS